MLFCYKIFSKLFAKKFVHKWRQGYKKKKNWLYYACYANSQFEQFMGRKTQLMNEKFTLTDVAWWKYAVYAHKICATLSHGKIELQSQHYIFIPTKALKDQNMKKSKIQFNNTFIVRLKNVTSHMKLWSQKRYF